MLINEKAKRLYEDLKKKQGKESEGASFNASHGWFHWFKARANLHNVKVSGEAVTADMVAAWEFPEMLREIIDEGTYCTNEDLMELEAQRKDEERQEEEEVTEEPKRFMTQEMAREFSLFEEALLVFEAQDLNVERYTKAAAAIQNAIRCYRVIYDEKKKSYYPDITGSFSQEDR